MIGVLKNCVIRSDKLGDGHYLAKRGSRLHRGVDYVVKPYERIFAPIDGLITRKSFPYKNDLKYTGIVLQGNDITLKIWYFSPIESLIGTHVKAGTLIGFAQDISKKYGKDMTPHIHVEVADMNIDLLMRRL